MKTLVTGGTGFIGAHLVNRLLSRGHVVTILDNLSRPGGSMGVEYGDWRPGDQKIFISDNRRALRDLNWAPRVAAHDGITTLVDWVRDHLSLFASSE